MVHHPRIVERVFHEGFPVTPVPRTLRDLATVASERELRKVLAEVDFLGLASPAEVRGALASGAPGSAALRAALARHLPELAVTASPLEDEFLFLCESAGFRIPEVNRRVGGFKVDALWREPRLIVNWTAGTPTVVRRAGSSTASATSGSGHWGSRSGVTPGGR